MNASLISQIKAARRVSVPIVAVTTPDPAATIASICEAFNGKNSKGARLVWNIVEGLGSLNKESRDAVTIIIGEQGDDGRNDPTIGNPIELLRLARKNLPAESTLFMHMANRMLAEPSPSVIQGIWNVRDVFKSDRRMLVLLGPSIDLPAELAGDVVVLDEPLPAPETLREIIEEQYALAKDGLPSIAALTGETLCKSVEAVQGLPAFQAEQVVAMSLSGAGVDVPALWERKRRQIELTPGLKVHREGVRFAAVGGVDTIKSFLSRILGGQAKPAAVVFIDEIEKFMAGAIGGGGDTSGVSQDQLGTLLSYMQDHDAAGCVFVGPPGSAKSMVAKATGNEGGIPTIQLDLGAMKGSLVGQSEQHMRAALKVITSVSNGRSLWIATCNAISDLPPELRRRFNLGTFFFDLPNERERRAIWDIAEVKYGLERWGREAGGIGKLERPIDDGWTGAEIKQCCDIAWRLGCSLRDAAAFVVPVSKSAAEQLERLRRAADGKFLSASKPGIYRREEPNAQEPTARRRRAAPTTEEQ
ncbi:MAG: hypothetical protein QOE14_1978 [Humisphaera sp.]|nr:hypothetical protein [Humisphaera sp.]